MIPAVERVAVIDMGSNSWRLVVFGYEPGTTWWGIAAEVDGVEAVATSAIRDASNGDELLADIELTTGLQPRVISGEEEARYGWLAIANSTTIEDGFGLDIGGGSSHTLRLERRRMVNARSLPLGA